MFAQNGILEQKNASRELDFSAISVESINKTLEYIKNQYTLTYKKIAELKNSPDKITFEQVIQPLLDLDLTVNEAMTMCTFPRLVHSDKNVREVSVEATKQIENIKIDCHQNEDAFNVLRLYEENNYKNEQSRLSHEQNRYVKNLMLNYKRNGMYITEKEKREQIAQLQKSIADLSLQFEQNVAEDKTEFVMDAKLLSGLPESWFNADRIKDVPPGMVKVTLKYPDVFPILDFASNRETRQKIYLAFQSRCEKENIPLLKKIVILRQQLAHILGYSSHADYVMETRMAKTTKTVDSFLKDMNDRFDPLLDKNLNALTLFARELESNPDLILQHYDVRYYMRLREEKLCKIDMEEIRNYFPMEKMVSGTLKIYEDLLGLKFMKRENDRTWHSDCQLFDVYNYDSTTKTIKDTMGSFILDLHPREGKYTHACALPLWYGSRQSGEKQPTIAAMLCNFPKNDNIPFNDVVTFFHEFGHVMHFICSDAQLINFHADKTELDFVEAPSQMLENWCFVADALKLLSSHSQTHEPLPKTIADQLLLKDQLHAGYINKRQLVMGHFDFLLHFMSEEELNKCDLNQFYHEIQRKIIKLPTVSDCFPASFAHIVGGYDAGYYGYLMSETYSADMFATIFKQDPLSQKNGMKYRQEILAPGAKYDAIDLLINFLGRAPKLDAFLEKSGLETKPQPTKMVAMVNTLFSNGNSNKDNLEVKPTEVPSLTK